MAIPNLNPASTSNANILPVTGAAGSVATTLPFGIYARFNMRFLSGAADQVAYTYKKLGGDVLDIELAEGNVYAAYEEAVLEYSYLVNLFQTKNSLSSYLGASNRILRFRMVRSYQAVLCLALTLLYVIQDLIMVMFVESRRVSQQKQALVAQHQFILHLVDRVTNQQDYNLQTIISASSATDSSSVPYLPRGRR